MRICLSISNEDKSNTTFLSSSRNHYGWQFKLAHASFMNIFKQEILYLPPQLAQETWQQKILYL